MRAGRRVAIPAARPVALAFAPHAVLALVGLAAAPPAPATPAAGAAHAERTDAAQSGGRAATPDSATALRRARDAQRVFEHVRRRNFPRGPLVNPRCGEGIGRFCLVEGWDDDDWTPVPDVPEVVAERLALIAVLDSAARIVPGDEWLSGQRVAYRVEAGRAEEALSLLAACRAQGWWCGVLAGFVLQQSGRYGEAEAAFERALGRMTEEERCAWTAPGPVLDRRSRGRYDHFACGSAARRAVERSFWHLSDPLWLVDGRERRSEHLARRVRAALQADAASPWGLRWGDDLTEITLRFGWPAGWERARHRIVGTRTDEVVWSHRLPGAQRFTVSRVGASESDEESLWNLDEEDARTSWAPAFGEVLALPHQVASFRPDGRRRVVAAFAWPDSLPACDVESGLFLADAHGVIASRTGGAGPLAVGEPEAAAPATLVGVEARCREGPGAARARARLPDGHPLLSDLLLLYADGTFPPTLAAALSRARGDRTARAGETLAVYWEWYGAPASAALEVTLSLAREGKGFWRRALEWSGLVGRDPEQVGIRWRDAPDPASGGRTVELRLPHLDEGRYRLTLRVFSPAHGAAESSAEIEVIAAPSLAAAACRGDLDGGKYGGPRAPTGAARSRTRRPQ